MLLGVAFSAALVAAMINALAGGGTLVSFPVLIALGIPPVAANITNTIGLCPGYFSGIYAQRKDFVSQKKRLYAILPLSILGGIVGGLLLIHSDEQSFELLVPYLILIASLLLAVQVPVKRWLQSRSLTSNHLKAGKIGAAIFLFMAAVYGGYFGPGVSVIIIALLGFLYDDPLNRLNVLKLAISFSINISAALYFIFSGSVVWPVALVMCLGAIAGGFAGGVYVEKINHDILRFIVIGIGIIISIIYLIPQLQGLI